jgi:hypothetical protein
VAISITMTKTNGFSETFTADWDDAVMNRFLDWAKAAYPNNTGTGGPGDPVVSTPPSNAQAAKRAARGFINGTKNSIRAWEKQEAMKLADLEPAPIADAPAV